MIEPTETESRETLDRFAEALERSPSCRGGSAACLQRLITSVSGLDEVSAARRPRVCWTGNRKSD